MAARATRSASRKARVTEAVSTGPLGALSHDELGVIFDGLADPLQPVVAVALSSTCLGLRTPLQAALQVLRQRHARAGVLCRKLKRSRLGLHDAENLYHIYDVASPSSERLDAGDMTTLGMILRTCGLLRLKSIHLNNHICDYASLQALSEGLGGGGAPSLESLGLIGCNIGPAGAEALGAALSRGVLPNLQSFALSGNRIGSQGVAALAPALRKLPALQALYLMKCGIVDKDMASLFADLGKNDFKKLETLCLITNLITDAGVASLVTAIDAGALPELKNNEVRFRLFGGHFDNPASDAAIEAVQTALKKRSQ